MCHDAGKDQMSKRAIIKNNLVRQQGKGELGGGGEKGVQATGLMIKTH